MTVERLHRLVGPAAERGRRAAIADVLVASFAVEPERRVAIELEALQGLTTDAYHASSSGSTGDPAAVARRTTFAGASYLSSIGTDPAFRGRGLGRLVTSLAVADALAAGSRWTYLGVFEENTRRASTVPIARLRDDRRRRTRPAAAPVTDADDRWPRDRASGDDRGGPAR